MGSENTTYETLHKYTKALSVALGYRDRLTQLHSERVLYLSAELGEKCNLSNEKLGILKIAASFHDIGKIGIPDPVLLKPGSFDEKEWRVMKKHPLIGAEIMVATELDGANQASEVIRCHHEHYDGSGYPDGLLRENIPISSRIISIADAYDAMVMTRSYHTARTHQEIMVILRRETGQTFDPTIMSIFGKLIEYSKYKVN